MIPVYIIVGLVLIGLPVLLGKLTGTNPMEIMFGQRVNNTIFGRKKKEQEDSADNGADSETSTESAESSGKKEKSRRLRERGARSNPRYHITMTYYPGYDIIEMAYLFQILHE